LQLALRRVGAGKSVVVGSLQHRSRHVLERPDAKMVAFKNARKKNRSITTWLMCCELRR
jgi:hypothetical protein